MNARLAVVDDTTVLRRAVLGMLGMESAGDFATVEELLEQRPSADLVLLDLHLASPENRNVRQGVAAVAEVVGAGYTVCAYSQEERRFVLAACLAAGARGVLSKSASLERTREGIAAVLAGELVAPEPVLGVLQVLVRRRSLTIIGPRLRDVLAGRARGLTFAQIGQLHHLSESTVRGYWRDLTLQVEQHLEATTAAQIEHALGLAPGDLMDVWPNST